MSRADEGEQYENKYCQRFLEIIKAINETEDVQARVGVKDINIDKNNRQTTKENF